VSPSKFPTAAVNVSGSTQLVARPGPSSHVAGFDVSCHVGDLGVVLPDAAMYGGNSYEASLAGAVVEAHTVSNRAGVDVNMSPYPAQLVPRINRLDASTTAGVYAHVRRAHSTVCARACVCVGVFVCMAWVLRSSH
jgi:hypothetical protein